MSAAGSSTLCDKEGGFRWGPIMRRPCCLRKLSRKLGHLTKQYF